jgi:hypothetical protein
VAAKATEEGVVEEKELSSAAVEKREIVEMNV